MKKFNVLLAILVNAVITVVVATGLTYNDPGHWFEYLYGSFIFSNCIGFSIYGLVYLVTPRVARFGLFSRILLLFFLFLFGGFVGTEAALGILFVVSGMSYDAAGHLQMLLFNSVLAEVFGSVAVLYFSLRERTERLAVALKEKELAEERLTRLKTKAELDALQTKINPHFLFNTLNSIAGLISENPSAAEETVERLSELFRHSLRHTEKDSVTLAEELDLIRTYLEIEKVRLGDRLQYDVRCEEGLRDVMLPAMLIQPLVENSIKHGIATAVGGGSILIDAKELSGACVISVRDSGKEFQEPGEASGFGLRSIQERLKLRYGERASLHIVRNGHAEIVITIPLK
jgi:two-component system LytT family sensor kinase